MSLLNVSAGDNLPNTFNAIIEIPMDGAPIKYEVDKQSGALVVDRFMSTAMHYPCNYGYIPQTLSEDGDPVDVLVITPWALNPGVVIACRPVALMEMVDENGPDNKVIALPDEKLTPIYNDIKEVDGLPAELLGRIAHFFAHYKDLEAGKFTKVGEFKRRAFAELEIKSALRAYSSGLWS